MNINKLVLMEKRIVLCFNIVRLYLKNKYIRDMKTIITEHNKV